MISPPNGPNKYNHKCYYKLDTIYTLSLNPSEHHQFLGKPNRLRLFHAHMREVYSALTCEYETYIEVSEPYGKQQHGYLGPLLHTHGVIRFKTHTQLLTFMLLSYHHLCKYGRIEIGKSTDEWSHYCTKQHIIPRPFNYFKTPIVISKKTRDIRDAYDSL